MSYSVTFHSKASTYAGLVVAIADVDRMTQQSTRTIGTAARAAYRSAVPSKAVARAVTTRQRKRGNTRTIRTGVSERPTGRVIGGKDVGTQAVGWFTDRGTANAGQGWIHRRTKDERGNPLPFWHWGFPVARVRGQVAQNWSRTARDGADVVSARILDELSLRVSARLATPI